MKTITIGRGSSNNIVLKPGDISEVHAQITDLENGEYRVEDLDSTNGVYVNGYRIKKTNVSSNDEVRLSASYIIDLDVLFSKKQGQLLSTAVRGNDAITANNKKDWTLEFSQLKKVYDDYIKKKKQIIEGNQRKQTLQYIGFMSLPVIVQFYTKDVMFSGATILLGSLARLLPGATKYLDKLEELNDSFKVRFVCPSKNCKQMLVGNSWTVWHETGECPRCKAVYNKNKL